MKFCQNCSRSMEDAGSKFCARPDCVADRTGVRKREKPQDRVEVKQSKRRRPRRGAKRKGQWEAREVVPLEERAKVDDRPKFTALRYLEPDRVRELDALKKRLEAQGG